MNGIEPDGTIVRANDMARPTKPNVRRGGVAVGFRGSTAIALATTLGCVVPLSSTTTDDGGGTVGTSAESGVAADGGTSGNGVDGAPPGGNWTNVTSNLANMPSECGNLTGVFAKPDEDLVIAGVAQKGLWASGDGGTSWQALGMGSDSGAMITNRPAAIVFDPQNPAVFWESGSYGGGGAYKTMDDGASFLQLGNVHQCDAISVDFSDPLRRTLLASAHEQQQTVFRSTDGGTTWANVGSGLPASANCSFPLVLDNQSYLVGCAMYGGGASGVYRTADGGTTWSRVTMLGGGAALVASDGSIYWANADGSGLARGSADGQTWTDLIKPGVTIQGNVIELPDGRIATLGSKYIMAYSGSVWKPVSAALPYSDAGGISYSRQRKAFYIWHNDCGGIVLPDAIMRFDFDYQKN